MNHVRTAIALLLVFAIAFPQAALPANHREAPITALDHKADITDVFAFVSYSTNQAPGTPPSKVTMILNVDPLLEPRRPLAGLHSKLHRRHAAAHGRAEPV